MSKLSPIRIKDGIYWARITDPWQVSVEVVKVRNENGQTLVYTLGAELPLAVETLQNSKLEIISEIQRPADA